MKENRSFSLFGVVEMREGGKRGGWSFWKKKKVVLILKRIILAEYYLGLKL